MIPPGQKPLAERYAAIKIRIKEHAQAGVQPVLIAVSKTQPVEAIEALYALGHRDFGENYVQELVRKSEALREKGCADIRWHFIGHLQTNKVKQLLPHLYAIHTIHSDRLAAELAKRWSDLTPSGKLPVFIEVNIDREEGKSGCPPEDARGIALRLSLDPVLSANLSLQGLMCIPDPDQPGGTRASFQRLKDLGSTIPSAGQLSMGMSDDFEAALEQGATHIRIGTALFGERNRN